MLSVEANFAPALQCLFQPKRYKVLYGGRGAGRSWGCARALLLLGTQRSLRILCAREFQNSISESVLKVLSDQIDLLGLGTFYVVQANKIIGLNGTTFSFEGIKNNTARIKSYEGIDICWVEEANKVSKTSWGILIPTIRKAQSEIWMTFNPELETDYTYQRFVKEANKVDPNEAFVVKMTYRDNPWFEGSTMKGEMEQLKATDYDSYLNIWEGFCLQMLEGVVYAKELRRAQEEGRITAVPYDRSTPVDLFFDLGRADNTSIWFHQRVAMQSRMIRFFEDNGEDITYFLQEIQKFGYLIGTIFLPHDARAKHLGTKKSIEEIIRGAGYRVQIVPKLSISDGINAARIVFPSVWFDEENCSDGLNSLRHYRYRVIDGQLSNDPLHDWASDGADAFRYFGISAGRGRPTSPATILERLLGKEPSSRPLEINRGGGGASGLGWMG